MVRAHTWETMLAGKWAPIGDHALQDSLDAAFICGADGYRYEARGWKYDVDLQLMRQINLSTKRMRDIRRAPMQEVDVVVIPAAVVPKVKSSPASKVKADVAAKVVLTPKVKVLARPKTVDPPASLKCSSSKMKLPAGNRGKVKDFFAEKGFGFLVMTSTSEEVFFHVSALQACTVKRNDVVECGLAKDRSGRTRASRIVLVSKAPLLRMICRNPICRSKKENHFEDRCTRGGFIDDLSLDTGASTGCVLP